MNPVCLAKGAKALGSAYSVATGVPPVFHAIKSNDKENATEGFLNLSRSAILYLETRAALITGVSALSARLFSYEFGNKLPVISPVIGGVVGVVGCTIDGILESRGIFHCTRFLKDPFFSKDPTLLNELQNTANLQDPLQKKEARTEIIKKIIKQLEPTPLTQKIESVFEEVVRRELDPLPSRLTRFWNALFSPSEPKMTYEELEKKIEAADWVSKLNAFKATHLGLTQAQQEKISRCAKKKHPDDLEAREEFKQKKVQSKEALKALTFKRRVGDSYAKKIQDSIDPLLTNLASEDLATQTQALSDGKKLLESTEMQAKKLRLLHLVGLISAVITGISFLIALCVTCAPALPLILGIIGTIIYVTRYLLACELMENEGWKFSLVSSLKRGFAIPITENLIDPVTNAVNNIYQRLFGQGTLSQPELVAI